VADKVKVKLLQPRRMFVAKGKKENFEPGTEHLVTEASAADLIKRGIAKRVEET
jgi:hypothetical protein